MPFVRYEAPSKPPREPKPTPDVKIGSLGLSIKKSAMQQFGLSEASHVTLWFDADTNSVAISKAESTDKSSFKATPRGKTGDNIFIAAGKYYSRFGIEIKEKNATADLKEVEGMAAFQLPGGKPQSSSTAPYTGAKRGRKSKTAEA